MGQQGRMALPTAPPKRRGGWLYAVSYDFVSIVMRILVTGGSGFIGSNLVRVLLAQGHSVICLDNNYTGRMSNIEELLDNPRFTFIRHDICNSLISLPELCPQKGVIDQIYNLACPASPPAYQGAHALDTTRTCTIGVFNVLELAVAHNATILQASTSEVYGDPLVRPQPESYRGNVNTHGIRACYDEGKRCAESIFFDYARIYGLKIKVIRIFNTYGTFMDPDDGRVVSNFICQALQGKDITIYGDGHQTRSFCYVDDLVTGMTATMNSPADFTGPVNLGNPNEFTIRELAEKVTARIKNGSRVVYHDLPQDDPQFRCPDITLAKTRLNWAPTIMLDEGLERTIEWFARCLNIKAN